MNTPTLETERLILRKFTKSDIDAMYEIYSDGEVNKKGLDYVCDSCCCHDYVFRFGEDGDDMTSHDKQQTVISFENVSFQYPGAKGSSVKDINLDIKAGEFVVLTGSSGCGKTTITRIINGLAEKFYEGTPVIRQGERSRSRG